MNTDEHGPLLLYTESSSQPGKGFCASSWERTHPVHHEDAKKSQRTFFASSCLRGEIFLVAALLLVFICVHLWFHFVQSRNKFGLCCRAERGWRGASDGRYLARRVMSEQQRRSGLRPQPG